MDILFTSSAMKDIKSLDKGVVKRVMSSIGKILDKTGDIKKLKNHQNLYRLRVGDYRIIFQIDNNKEVVYILSVKHRSEVYNDLN